MIIECTNCHARYQYDEDRFERKPSKKIKCAKCSTIFDIHNPAFAERPVAASVSADSTLMRRDAAKKPPQDTEPQKALTEEEQASIKLRLASSMFDASRDARQPHLDCRAW